MLDILIQNATVIDGSGAAAYTGTVGIKDGKLVMEPGDAPAAKVIDAAGRVVCPGFIDAHSHGDRILGTKDARLFKTTQGITTELCGNCGNSEAPVDLEKSNQFSLGQFSAEQVRKWTDFSAFLDDVQDLSLTVNARFYVGHNNLRRMVVGDENRPATAAELDRMCGILRESMEAGAAGLSTGLIYVPGCYADTHEVVELAKVIAPFGGIYTSHIRNEAEKVSEAVDEVIEIGRRAGVRVDISHHKMLGKPNWGNQKITLEQIYRANEEGIQTTCDQYPYTRNMTSLSACMPNAHLSGGRGVLTEKLRDPAFRARVRREMEDPAIPYDNYYLNAGGWEGVYITKALKTPEAAGHFVSEFAERLGKDPWETYFDLMVENGCDGSAVFCSMCEEDVCQIIQSPYCVVGTDGFSLYWSEKGHPRASSTFPHAINLFVKQKKILTLEQMIHKMTGLTAQRLLVRNKGLLKTGYDADVLIFDYDRLRDTATFDDPHRKCEGMDYVIVNGQVVYHNMAFTGVHSGRIIRQGDAHAD